MSLRIILGVTAGLALFGPSQAQAPTMADLMNHSVNPAALAFWAAGNDPPADETAAQAEARWAAAIRGAETLRAEARRLNAPPHLRDGEWAVWSRAMGETAAEALPALRARDAEAAFAAGGRLYDSCNGCHKAYVPPRT